MKLNRTKSLTAFSFLLILGQSVPALAGDVFLRSPEKISQGCANYMSTFDSQVKALVADKSTATYQNVFAKFDDHLTEFADALLPDYLIQNVHTKEATRKAATACTLKGFAAFNGLNVNRPLYDRMSQVDIKGLSEEKAFTVNYWKQQFESSGIGKDETTRNKIKQVNDEISQLSTTFSQNISKAVKSIEVKPERLAGLPQDYFDSHPVNDNGLVTITTAYSDTTPITKYAHDASLREQVSMMSRSRAVTENQPVLKALLNKRYELAKLLGHHNYAVTDMLGTMVAKPANVVSFTDKLSAAIKQPVSKELARLLKQKQKTDPSAQKVERWDSAYLSNIIRETDYQLDAKKVREYFDYDKVRDGIVALSETLFGLTIKPVKSQTWHDSVEPYEVYENNQLIGRFYLDSHPREGKYTHAAQFSINLGKKGQSIPVAALVMNFPKGLMEHNQVETFLHEYGHLLHFIFAGQNAIGNSRFQGESDFNEAPSMMLEEWVWDYDTLKEFATNTKGEVIPKSLVDNMTRARYFGQALRVATQLTYTAFSFEMYNQNPTGIDLDKFEKQTFDRYSPYGYIDGMHMHASFNHLAGYGAKYYTYQWSNAIAEELLSRFKKEGLRNKKTASDYRYKVLAPTGTKPAAQLVKEFLGREFSVNAYAEKLSKGG